MHRENIWKSKSYILKVASKLGFRSFNVHCETFKAKKVFSEMDFT